LAPCPKVTVMEILQPSNGSVMDNQFRGSNSSVLESHCFTVPAFVVLSFSYRYSYKSPDTDVFEIHAWTISNCADVCLRSIRALRIYCFQARDVERSLTQLILMSLLFWFYMLEYLGSYSMISRMCHSIDLHTIHSIS